MECIRPTRWPSVLSLLRLEFASTYPLKFSSRVHGPGYRRTRSNKESNEQGCFHTVACWTDQTGTRIAGANTWVRGYAREIMKNVLDGSSFTPRVLRLP